MRHPQQTYALIISLLLMAKGLIGLLSPGPLLGVYSTTLNHNFFYAITGLFFLLVGLWGKESTATGWNKFLGWLFALIGVLGIMRVGFMTDFLGVNRIADDVFNLTIACTSLAIGYVYGKAAGPYRRR